MPDASMSRSRLRKFFTLRQVLVTTGFFFYGLALFLVFDFAYSSLTRGEEKQRPLRIANPVYDLALPRTSMGMTSGASCAIG